MSELLFAELFTFVLTEINTSIIECVFVCLGNETLYKEENCCAGSAASHWRIALNEPIKLLHYCEYTPTHT